MQKIETRFEMTFALTSEGQKAQDALASAVSKHNEKVSELATAIDKLRQEAEENWTANRETEVSKIQERRALLLKAEIEIRGRIAEFLDHVRDVEIGAFVDAAIRQKESVEREIRDKLVAIGYVHDEYGRTLPMLVANHPAVNRAIERIDSVHCKSLHLPPMNDNRDALAKAESELADLKNRALAGLGV